MIKILYNTFIYFDIHYENIEKALKLVGFSGRNDKMEQKEQKMEFVGKCAACGKNIFCKSVFKKDFERWLNNNKFICQSCADKKFFCSDFLEERD